MKISVFTSNYNNASYIAQAIESVLNQSYTDFEYLIYDDGSTDDSLNIIKEYENDKRVKIFKLDKQDNVGVIINKSFDESNGDYWCWCPADDYFDKDLLKIKIEYAQKFPKSVLYNNAWIIDKDNNITKKRETKKMSSEKFEETIWCKSRIGFTGIFIPKYVYKNFPFPEHLKFSEDYYWMIKSTIYNIPFDGVPEFLSYKRRHNDSVTSKNLNGIIRNMSKIKRELLKLKEGIKLLILGHNGMLGNMVYKYFNNRYIVYVCDFRWDSNEFKDFIINCNVDFIINCIGAIPQKKYKSEDYDKINVDLPIFLESIGKKVLHPSTDCEFSGDIPYPEKYKKTDERDANDDYGKSKAKISKIIVDNFKNTKIIRTSIIGHELNSNKSLLDWFLSVDEKEEVNGYVNYYWNGITTLFWCKIAEKIMLNWDNSDVITQIGVKGLHKCDLLRTIRKVYKKSVKINEFSMEKPLNKMLETDYEISNIKKQLIALKKYNKK